MWGNQGPALPPDQPQEMQVHHQGRYRRGRCRQDLCHQARCPLARCHRARWPQGRRCRLGLQAAVPRTVALHTAMPRRTTCFQCSICSRHRQCGSFRPCSICSRHRRWRGHRLPTRALTWVPVQVWACLLHTPWGCPEGTKEAWLCRIQPQLARDAPGRPSSRSRNESSSRHARAISLMMIARSRSKMSR